MPSPKSKTKPVLSMSRPKIDPAAADAFVRGAGGAAAEAPPPFPDTGLVSTPQPDPTSSPKLVEFVSPEAAEQPTQVATPEGEEKVVDDVERKASRKTKAKKGRRESKAVGRGIVTRSTGRQVRRRVVYLPPSLDKKLAIAAATRGEDVSEVVASLLNEHL